MRDICNRFVILAVGATLPMAFPSSILAQETPMIQFLQGAERPEFGKETQARRISLDVSDLKLADMVEHLSQVFPEMNFVVPGLLGEVGIPSLKLRSAGLRDILMAIGIASGGVVDGEVKSPTLVAFVQPGPIASPAPTSAPRIEVMNLKEVLRLQDPHRIDLALEYTREIADRTLRELARQTGATSAQRVPELNYHSDTGVLVLIGPRDSIELVMKIVRSLRIDEPVPETSASSGPEPEQAAE